MKERSVRRPEGLCVETKGREILADLVHGEIDDAMRIGRFDTVLPDATGEGRMSDGDAGQPAIEARRVKRTR